MAKYVFSSWATKPWAFKPAALAGVGPAAAGDPVGWFKWRAPRATRPSYKGNFARSPDQSAYPGLHVGLIGTQVPALGITGTTIRDTVNTNDGVITNVTPADAWVNGRNGPAIQFISDASVDHIELPVENTDPTNLTVSMWFKQTSAPATAILFSHRTVSANVYFQITCSAGNIILQLRSSTSGAIVLTGTSITLNSWHHVVGQMNRTTGSHDLWLDGVQVATDSTVFGGTFQGIRRIIGGFPQVGDPGNPFFGQWDAAYLYDRALQPNEIKTLYRDSLAPFRECQTLPFVGGNLLPYGSLCIKEHEIYSPGATVEEIYVPGAAAEQIGC